MSRRAIAVVWVLSAIAAVSPGTSPAQTINDAGQWNALFARGSVFDEGSPAENLRWWYDGHLRLRDDSGGFNQSIVRPGIG